MSPNQILREVKLPLAMPVIVAGVRTALVWTVGLATLSTLVGATSFGNYIFTGLQTRNLVAVTVGSLASAGLAVSLDSLVAAVQWLLEKRSEAADSARLKSARISIYAVAALVLCIALYGLVPKPRADFVVAGKPFTEQYIMAGLLTQILEEAGFSVEQRLGMGTAVVYEAIRNGTIDAYVEYTGTVWANFMDRESNPGREGIRSGVAEFLEEQNIAVLGLAGFQNRYALAMRRDHAAELGVTSIEDLVPIADELSAGSDLEFFGRTEWLRLRDLYDMDFGNKLTFDVSLMYTALDERQVDVISAYTTDGRVAVFDLLILDDPRNALLAYDGIVLASANAAAQPEFMEVVATMVDSISDEVMRQANRLVDVDGESINVAVEYLRSEMAKN